MNLVHAITTYNRLDNLKLSLDSWINSRDTSYNWTLIIADDGSTDGTSEYLAGLNIDKVKILHIKNIRRGVHHQTNCIFRLCENLDFKLGFKADDDVIYTKGWDTLYINASKACPHLVFHDPQWQNTKSKVYETPIEIVKSVDGIDIKLEIRSNVIQGAFWTFTSEMIKNVGFFDVNNMGICGIGHQDYTLRCQRLGFNLSDSGVGAADAARSYVYLRLQDSKTIDVGHRRRHNSNEIVNKKNTIKTDLTRKYFPYSQPTIDMNLNKLIIPDISFIVPIRDRKEMREGLEQNLKNIFSNKQIEIIYVNQNNNELFMRGQLCNIGFIHSLAEIIVFQDVDMRYLYPIDFSQLKNGPFVGWDKIVQINTNKCLKDKSIAELEQSAVQNLCGFGGSTVFTRSQFILAGGFSNLPIGWGGEDNILADRAKIRRLPGVIAHVSHPASISNKRVPWYQRNYDISISEKYRNKYLDGFAQTAFDANLNKNNSIDNIYVNNISVYKNFKYIDLMPTNKKIFSESNSNITTVNNTTDKAIVVQPKQSPLNIQIENNNDNSEGFTFCIATRQSNKVLYRKMLNTINNIECDKLSFNTFHYKLENAPTKYLLHLQSLNYDYAINLDEDCNVFSNEELLSLLNFMDKNNYDYCGLADGGAISHRKHNPISMNPFFNIFKVKTIKQKIHLFDSTNYSAISNDAIEKFKSLKIENLNENDIQYDEFEAYYPFFSFLLMQDFKPLYLTGTTYSDNISTIVKFNNPFLIHSWYARQYNHHTHKQRIDKVFEFSL